MRLWSTRSGEAKDWEEIKPNEINQIVQQPKWGLCIMQQDPKDTVDIEEFSEEEIEELGNSIFEEALIFYASTWAGADQVENLFWYELSVLEGD